MPELPHGPQNRSQGWLASGSGLVFAVEQFRDAGLVKYRCEGVGKDFGHGEDFNFGEVILGREGQGVGENNSANG